VYGTILAESFDPEAVVAGLGECFRIEQNYFKFHACCRMNHPALDALMSLRAEHRFTGDDVATVQITSIPFGLRMLETAPETMLGAKFSIPYAVAAALVLGRTDTAAFEERVLDDERIRAMAKRVDVSADDQMTLKRADYPTAHVRVGLRDGRVLSQTTGVVRGDAANPVAPQEVVAKFLSLASGRLGDRRAHEVIEAVDAVDSLKNVRDLTALLASPQA
jgi:2-methylcitrate dehydratase PrpD